MPPLICICCGCEHDRTGQEMCLFCASLLAQSEADIAAGRVQDADEVLAAGGENT